MKERLPLIRHVGLKANSVSYLMKWYERLGMVTIGILEEKWEKDWLVTCKMRDAKGQVLELVEPVAGSLWENHVALGVEDFPKKWNTETSQPVKRGRLWVWFGEDPDGNRVELVKEGG